MRTIAFKEPGFWVGTATKTWFLVSCIVVLLSPLTAYADDLPPTAFVEGLVGHPQEHNLSCESRSATDLAAF